MYTVTLQSCLHVVHGLEIHQYASYFTTHYKISPYLKSILQLTIIEKQLANTLTFDNPQTSLYGI